MGGIAVNNNFQIQHQGLSSLVFFYLPYSTSPNDKNAIIIPRYPYP